MNAINTRSNSSKNEFAYTAAECAATVPMEAREVMLACTKGRYQVNLLRGVEAWSGSTIKGKARSYGDLYARSRHNLVLRMRAALRRIDEDYDCSTALVGGRRVLLVELPNGDIAQW